MRPRAEPASIRRAGALLAGLLALLLAVPALARADAGAPVSANEGQAFSGRVANTNCAFSNATIDWGDGTSASTGSDAGSPPGVAGSHTYAEEGRYTGTVRYGTNCLRFGVVQFTATVADSPLTATGVDATGTQGQGLNATVAHFTDADANAAVGDYTASIAWGDGSTSSGTVAAAGGGGFDVSGSHTYASPGRFTVSTSLADSGGATTSASSTAQIAPATTFVVVHTLGVAGLTDTGAQPFGTVNDGGTPVGYHFEYGTSPAYGTSTATAMSDGSGADRPVAAALTGLTPDTDYHVRLVADALAGPVYGEDVAFHTARAGSVPGLPAGLDFTWSPRADVLVAGAPAGGVQFQATPGTGVDYRWSFDSPPGSAFAPDPSATGNAPRHGFSADGAHDTDKAQGATGDRRRLYTVRLRATAANGASVEISHDLVVVPNAPPLVDFVTDGEQGANAPTTLTPEVSDPAGPRVADHIDHIEWSFDTPTSAHPAGDPSTTDLVCNADGSGCRAPGGAAPGPWFSQGDGHQAVVNFFQRALAVHGLPELSTLNLNALPQTAPDGTPLTGGLRLLDGQGLGTVYHDLRVAYLYDNSTLLEQTSFALDAGEATGAQLNPGTPLGSADHAGLTHGPQSIKRISGTTVRQTNPGLRLASVLGGRQLEWRQVTLTAVDTAGVRSSVTRSVPLRTVPPPDLRAKFIDESAARIIKVGHRTIHLAPETQTVPHAITTRDELAFDPSGTQDPTGRIAYYTLEVGRPQGCRAANGHPQQQYQGLPTINSVDPPVAGYGPGEFFGRPSAAGAGRGLAAGRAAALAALAPNPRNILGVGFGGARTAAVRPLVDPSSLPTLGQKLAAGPVVHGCFTGFAARNVAPIVFLARRGTAARPPIQSAAPIGPHRASPLDYPTTALVTNDPSALRFTIPTPGTWSVTLAAYNDAGLAAIQRTDGFKVEKAAGGCEPVTGALELAGKQLGFSGDCAAVGGTHRSLVWASGDLTVNGVTLRPSNGAHLFVDTAVTPSLLFATHDALPADLDHLDAKQITEFAKHASPAGVQVVFERDPVAKYPDFNQAVATHFIEGGRAPENNPAVFAGATYHGSPVATADTGGANWDTLHIDFGRGGDSTAHFRVLLPKEFSSESAPASPTSNVVRDGHTDVPSIELVTNHFATVARGHHHANGGPRASAAAAGVSGSLSLDNTHLGPLTINSGTLSFDSAQGTWTGDIHDAYLEMFPEYKVSAHILIQNGALRELGGKVDGLDIPVFAGVFLNELHFQIVTDPLTLSGGAGLTALGGALTGNLDLIIRTKPVFLRLEGRIAVASIPLAKAYVQYDEANHDTVSFGGHLGIGFGPVSMNADLDGAISGQTGDFFIQGQGEVCVGICLDAGALMSNVAVALCGGFHVGPLKLEAGAAFRFHPAGLEVFAGCDLDPYKPAIFRAREVRGGGGVGQVRLAASDLPVAAGTHEVAFRFHGSPSAPGAPSVTLISPTGRMYSTAPTAGDYAFTAPVAAGSGVSQVGGALIDRDPVDHITTAVIVNPPAGNWQVRTPPAQAAITSVDIARGDHLPDTTFQGSIGGAALDASQASRQASSAAVSIAVKRVQRVEPAIERHRIVSVQLRLPAGVAGKLKLLDVGPTSTAPIQTVELNSEARRVTIAFVPSNEPGIHQIQAIKYQPAGAGGAALPQRTFVVGTYVAPPVPTPSAPTLDVHRDRAGHVLVDVTPGSAGTLTGHGTTFEVVVSTAAGERIEQVVYAFHGTENKRYRQNLNHTQALAHGRFRVTFGGIPQTTTVKVYGRMGYAGAVGRASSVLLRCHACRRGQ